jgi:hypothetical protein
MLLETLTCRRSKHPYQGRRKDPKRGPIRNLLYLNQFVTDFDSKLRYMFFGVILIVYNVCSLYLSIIKKKLGQQNKKWSKIEPQAEGVKLSSP